MCHRFALFHWSKPVLTWQKNITRFLQGVCARRTTLKREHRRLPAQNLSYWNSEHGTRTRQRNGLPQKIREQWNHCIEKDFLRETPHVISEKTSRKRLSLHKSELTTKRKGITHSITTYRFTSFWHSHNTRATELQLIYNNNRSFIKSKQHLDTSFGTTNYHHPNQQ